MMYLGHQELGFEFRNSTRLVNFNIPCLQDHKTGSNREPSLNILKCILVSSWCRLVSRRAWAWQFEKLENLCLSHSIREKSPSTAESVGCHVAECWSTSSSTSGRYQSPRSVVDVWIEQSVQSGTRVANGILESDYSNGSYEIIYVSTFFKNNNTGGIIQLGYCYISIFMDR